MMRPGSTGDALVGDARTCGVFWNLVLRDGRERARGHDVRVPGKIGSCECMTGQVALLEMSSMEFDAHLDDLSIDPHFAAFERLRSTN